MKILLFLILFVSISSYARDWSDPQQTPQFSNGAVDTRIGDVLFIDGEIHNGQARELEFGAFKGVSLVVLNSPGGDGISGENLARVIRSQKLTTVVPAGGTCSSACTFAFQGGVDRIAFRSSSFMYHGPRFSLDSIKDELYQVCESEGEAHCMTLVYEEAFYSSRLLINDVFHFLESLDMSTGLFNFYRSLPDEPQNYWKNSANYYRKPNLYFVDDYNHSSVQSKPKTGVIASLDYLLRFKVVTELRD